MRLDHLLSKEYGVEFITSHGVTITTEVGLIGDDSVPFSKTNEIVNVEL